MALVLIRSLRAVSAAFAGGEHDGARLEEIGREQFNAVTRREARLLRGGESNDACAGIDGAARNTRLSSRPVSAPRG